MSFWTACHARFFYYFFFEQFELWFIKVLSLLRRTILKFYRLHTIGVAIV